MALTTNSIRNIAICGHGETGKTTFVEQILYNGKVISKAETVDSGRTVSDFTSLQDLQVLQDILFSSHWQL